MKRSFNRHVFVLNSLKPLCRKQSEIYKYRPLGVLKRSMATQPTYGEANTHITTTTGVLRGNTSAVLVYRSPYETTYKVHLCVVTKYF